MTNPPPGPWWVDSLNVRDGETYLVAFVSDNPGLWMDHCHNLPHAGEGLVAHLMYEGVGNPGSDRRGRRQRPGVDRRRVTIGWGGPAALSLLPRGVRHRRALRARSGPFSTGWNARAGGRTGR